MNILPATGHKQKKKKIINKGKKKIKVGAETVKKIVLKWGKQLHLMVELI